MTVHILASSASWNPPFHLPKIQLVDHMKNGNPYNISHIIIITIINKHHIIVAIMRSFQQPIFLL